MSSFQILTCCRAPTPWAARGLKRAKPTSTRAPGRPKTSFTSLPSECPHAVRVSGESNPDLPIQSPARYLYATAAGDLNVDEIWLSIKIRIAVIKVLRLSNIILSGNKKYIIEILKYFKIVQIEGSSTLSCFVKTTSWDKDCYSVLYIIKFYCPPPFAKVGDFKSHSSVCSSVCPSITKTLTLLISSEVKW